MNKIASLSCLVVSTIAAQAQTATSFPCEEKGMEKGVSACFAGVVSDQLIVAGGCNFPDKPVAEGGSKHYYEGIYATAADARPLEWKLIGTLPEPAAYGLTLQMADGIVLLGGNNERGLVSVLRLSMDKDGQLLTDTLPSLPCPIDNMAGAVSGNSLYVVGGNADGKPSKAVLALSLKHLEQGWRQIAELPGAPRVQPVCAAVKNRLYVWGGFYADGDQSEVATDGLMYDLKKGAWSPLPAPLGADGEPLTLSGGTATAMDGKILCTGGVNRAIFLDAISGRYQLTTKAEYLLHPQEWYKFNDLALTYNTKAGRWEQPATRSGSFARAGATAASHNGSVFLIGGELKPGVRTPSIVVIKE